LADTARDRNEAPPGDARADVPEPLGEWLRAIPDDISGSARYAMAGGFVVAHYLGAERLAGEDDPFLRPGEEMPQWQITSRLVSIAEALFVLRGHPAFAALCDRLRGKALRSVFFEASVARRFAQAGFTLQTAGAGAPDLTDCGFITPGGAPLVNLRMCCLGTEKLARKSVVEALERAGEGMAEGLPAFLCCYYPQQWLLDCWDIDFSLGSIASDFLAGRGGINQVGFYREEFAQMEAGGAHFLAGFTERNPNPDVPSPELDRALRSGSGKELGAGEPTFFDWVDRARAARP
jgi:hypothetical protein